MHTKFIESLVTIPAADGVSIPAVFTNPSKLAQCVIMLHGITTHKDEYADFYRDMAHCLASEEVASLRIDFRGHGDSQVSSRSFSIASQVLDTIAAKDWIISQSEGQRVHIIASSFGAPPAIFLAKRSPSEIATLNLICPVLDYEATFLKPSTEWAKELFNSNTLSDAFNSGFLYMTDEFNIDVKLLLEMELIQPYKALREIKTPILIIHGEADSMVPYDISAKYVAGQNHIKFISVPEMDHGFNHEDDETGQAPASRRNFEFIVQTILDHIRRAM